MPDREHQRTGRWLRSFVVAILLLGVGLRFAAPFWNADTMHGDVGLFALSARELAENGALEYPHRANFLGLVPYEALREPASLHNPLFGAVTGILARWTGVGTYVVLRAITLLAGLTLLATAIWVAARSGWKRVPLVSALGVGLSPLLIDFSGNGSPYILLALWVLVATRWLGEKPPQRPASLIVFGVLSGLAVELHANQLGFPIAFALTMLLGRRNAGVRGAAIFLIAHLAARAPGLAWSWMNGIETFSAGGGAAFLYHRGLLQSSISDDGQLQFVRLPLAGFPFLDYTKQVLAQGLGFLTDLCVELGPFAVLLIVPGVRSVAQRRERWLAALPVACYLAVIALWAHHDHRFLVPLIPVLWWVVALGFEQLTSSGERGWKIVGTVLLVGALTWPGVRLLDSPRAQYYGSREMEYQQEYADMRALGTYLAEQPAGLILGWSRGEQTVWWHRKPYVSAVLADRPMFEALLRDFKPRYVLTNSERLETVQEVVPGARVLERRGQFVVLGLP